MGRYQGDLLLTGNVRDIGIEDVEYRNEIDQSKDKPNKPKRRTHFSLAGILNEIESKEPTIPSGPEAYKSAQAEKKVEEYDPTDPKGAMKTTPRSTKPNVPEYDPTAPSLGISKFLHTAESIDFRHGQEGAAKEGKEKKLPATSLPPRHPKNTTTLKQHETNTQEVPRLWTSISLCNHQRMKIFWSMDDPVNRKGTWSLEIRDYTKENPYLIMPHQHCKPARPSERAAKLAHRIIEDFTVRKRREEARRESAERRRVKMVELDLPQVPHQRRVCDEVLILAATWERARVRAIPKVKRVQEVAEQGMQRKTKAQANGKVLEKLQNSKKRTRDSDSDGTTNGQPMLEPVAKKQKMDQATTVVNEKISKESKTAPPRKESDKHEVTKPSPPSSQQDSSPNTIPAEVSQSIEDPGLDVELFGESFESEQDRPSRDPKADQGKVESAPPSSIEGNEQDEPKANNGTHSSNTSISKKRKRSASSDSGVEGGCPPERRSASQSVHTTPATSISPSILPSSSHGQTRDQSLELETQEQITRKNPKKVTLSLDARTEEYEEGRSQLQTLEPKNVEDDPQAETKTSRRSLPPLTEKEIEIEWQEESVLKQDNNTELSSESNDDGDDGPA